MPRKYVRKPGARRYRDYTEEHLLQAVNDCNNMPVKEVAKIYNIPFRTLWNKTKGLHKKSVGGRQALSDEEENVIAAHLLVCADYGMPLECMDIKLIVQSYLNKINKVVKVFKNNVPGDDWISGFLKRNDTISVRMCQNIKRSRAQVTPADIREYFRHLETSVKDVPACNILNYDETNLSDQPGTKKCVFRRGIKYPERVINYSKGNISIMFAGTASGESLPPYVIYKSVCLWDSWCEGGPAGTRFNRSESGWMDSTNFEDWFISLVVPWARRKMGKKILIGDNLSSHLSTRVVEKCNELNIGFVLLPPNSTDKCQPLDVSFFGPMKRIWRKVMTDYKMKNPKSTSLDKSDFPRLLTQLIDKLGMKAAENLVSGFRACGIVPLDSNIVLKKFPEENEESAVPPDVISGVVVEYLHKYKYSPGTKTQARGRKKKISVTPGKSVCAADLGLSLREGALGETESAVSPAEQPSHSRAEEQPSHSRAEEQPSHSPPEQPSQPRSEQLSDCNSEDESDSDSLMDNSDDEWVPPQAKKAKHY